MKVTVSTNSKKYHIQRNGRNHMMAVAATMLERHGSGSLQMWAWVGLVVCGWASIATIFNLL